MVKKGKQSRPSSNQTNPKVRNPTKAKAKAKGKGKGKGKKKVTKSNESNKPKKPPTAFFYFLEDFRKGYQEEHPEVKSMRDIGKACGEKWKMMTFEEKVQYYDIATEKRADFEKAMIEYVKRQESGEDMEKESDESDIYE